MLGILDMSIAATETRATSSSFSTRVLYMSHLISPNRKKSAGARLGDPCISASMAYDHPIQSSGWNSSDRERAGHYQNVERHHHVETTCSAVHAMKHSPGELVELPEETQVPPWSIFGNKYTLNKWSSIITTHIFTSNRCWWWLIIVTGGFSNPIHGSHDWWKLFHSLRGLHMWWEYQTERRDPQLLSAETI